MDFPYKSTETSKFCPQEQADGLRQRKMITYNTFSSEDENQVHISVSLTE